MFSRFRATIASLTYPNVQVRSFDNGDNIAARNCKGALFRKTGFPHGKILSKCVLLVGAALIWGGSGSAAVAKSDQQQAEEYVGTTPKFVMNWLGPPTNILNLGNGLHEWIYHVRKDGRVCNLRFLIGPVVANANIPPSLFQVLQAYADVRPPAGDLEEGCGPY